MKRQLICLAAIATVALLHGSGVVAAPLDSNAFSHRYDGNSYGAPGLTGSGTSFTEFSGEAGVWSPSTNGDSLSFRNSFADGGGFFRNDEWNAGVSDAVGWTMEWRVKIGTDFDDEPTFGAFNVFAKEPNNHATTNNALNNTTRRVNVDVGQDFVTIQSLSTTKVDTNDNTDAFHVFRIAQPANSGNITVWRDRVQIYSGISRNSNNTGVDLYLGDGSSGIGGPTVELDYFRWDGTGAYEPAVPGDFDNDGDVDGADFVAWQTNFPKAAGAILTEGDADADGDVDGADFVVWQTNFPFTPGAGVAPVPEPSSLGISRSSVYWRVRFDDGMAASYRLQPTKRQRRIEAIDLVTK